MSLAYSVGYGVGSLLGNILNMSLSKKSAEDSSALQYYYQSKLNQQNYKYNTQLINHQNAFNESMMDKANNWNLDRWNESVDLANTAHQREMADLKAAGLNPILAANGGASVVNPIQSAQASSGNSQLSSSAGMPDIDYVGALSTANAIRNENKRVENELENSDTQRRFVNQQRLNGIKELAIKDANSAAEIKKIDADIKTAQDRLEFDKDIENRRLQQDIKESKSRIAKNNSDIAYNKRRASGYSETYSSNNNDGYGVHLGPFGWNQNSAYGTAHSRTW